MKLHNDLIMELPGFVPETICKRIIEIFDKYPQKTVGSFFSMNKRQVVPKLKDCTESNTVLHSPENSNITICIEKYLRDALYIYGKYLNCEMDFFPHLSKLSNIDCYVHDGLNVQKQKENSLGYGWHYDSKPQSYVFGILYLNTLEPEEGGCTEFLSGRKVRPETGKLMFCPAHWTYAHSGHKVKKVDGKYILTFMFCLNA